MSRHGVVEVVDPAGAFPLATFLVNVVGAFVLGALLGWLLTHDQRLGGSRPPGHERTRLLVGTGLLGGFTTYSAFAVETDALLRADDFAMAALYAGGTVVLGLISSLAGVRVGRETAR